jgi:hypothetical protein
MNGTRRRLRRIRKVAHVWWHFSVGVIVLVGLFNVVNVVVRNRDSTEARVLQGLVSIRV